MTARTVTVQTSDAGPVTLPEPHWCTGDHEPGGYRVDISHYGPEVIVTTEADDGPRALVALMLAQHPDTVLPIGDAVHVVVGLADGYRPYDVAGLERLASDLVAAATEVRLMARRLGIENPGGAR